MTKLFPFLTIFLTAISYAQDTDHCGAEKHMDEFYSSHPEALERRHSLEEFTQNFSSEGISRSSIVIPVVFHVNDPSDPEKVTLAQAQSAIDILNEDFNGLNPDFEYVRDEFYDDRADIGVEFCLAAVDPDGNPTTGITYHYNSYNGREPDGYGSAVKGVEVWPTEKYLNIWIVNETEDDGSLYNSGWAFLPDDYWDDTNLDGIVYNHRYLGYGEGSSEVSGTDSWQAHMARILTHEVAHYFNLHHTFYNYCSSPGDYCDDTPYVYYHGSNNCEQLGEKCAGVSLVNDENYMDYTPCPRMFTEDQKDRMLAALYSDVARRNNLWTVGNLEATGCYVDFTSVEESQESELLIYPQPASSHLQIEYKNIVPGTYEINLLNLPGDNVLNWNARQLDENGIITLDLSEIPPGIYFLVLNGSETHQITTKIVKN